MKSFLTSIRPFAGAVPLILLANSALAGGTGMPWEAPAEQVTNSISGPVLQLVMTLLVIGAGVAFARSADAGIQKFAGIIFGGSIAGAFLFFTGLFGIGAGALI